MQVGPNHWAMVTTEEAGVPKGGKYGCVEWFEGMANRRGLKVAWSRRYKCFGIYTQPRATKCVFQLMLRNWAKAEPVAMTHQLLTLLCYIREKDAQINSETLIDTMMRQDDQRRKEKAEQYGHDTIEIVPDAIRAMRLGMGLSTPNFISMPGSPILTRRRRRRRR